LNGNCLFNFLNCEIKKKSQKNSGTLQWYESLNLANLRRFVVSGGKETGYKSLTEVEDNVRIFEILLQRGNNN
jgi:hypothetical protein